MILKLIIKYLNLRKYSLLIKYTDKGFDQIDAVKGTQKLTSY